MSTLKVNKIRDTSGSADAITLDPSGGAVLAGVTTMTTARITTGITTSIQVGGGVTISESGIEASGIGITCANINGTKIGGRRNLVINGAFLVAQRGTSSTEVGYKTVDRFNPYSSGTDEAPTQAQVDVSSGTDPYNEGFRKALKITNGNQTSGAQAASRVLPQYKFEAQDLANSGWNYTDPNSFITISFWVKSSIAQTYYGYVRTQDGTGRIYTYSVSLSADTWTKVVKTIPGNSGITINNDNGEGIQWNVLIPFAGTNYTDSGVSLNTWRTYVSGTRTPDYTTTWYTTNDATFELTGLQAEVGSQATPFEHRSFAEERLLCQRYYIKYVQQGCSGYIESNAGTTAQLTHTIPVPMRANPSTVCTTAASIGVERGGLYGINSTSGALGWMYENDLSIGWAMDTAKTRWHTTWCRVQNLELDAEL